MKIPEDISKLETGMIVLNETNLPLIKIEIKQGADQNIEWLKFNWTIVSF